MELLTAALLLLCPDPPKERFFEMREYYANPGKMEALHKRFKDHTNKLFVKHGMELVGYWVVASGDQAGQKLVFVLAYPDKEAREKSWDAFQKDPDWVKAKADSEKDGPLVAKAVQTFMTPTDYSPIK
ncbi:MAG TPA: NIPSNAP family protein [Planctomycetota bacterium]